MIRENEGKRGIKKKENHYIAIRTVQFVLKIEKIDIKFYFN